LTGDKHVCSIDFGDGVNFDEVALKELLEKSPRLCSTDAQMLLRDRYETFFNIYNHDNPIADNHPFALIRKNWNENVVDGNRYEERLKQYIDFDIQKYFGISIDEFLDRPRHEVESLIKIAVERIKKEAPIVQQAQEMLKNNKA